MIPELPRILESLKLTRSSISILRSCASEIRLTPRILIRSATGTFFLAQLSDGEQRLFSLFVDIARLQSTQRNDAKFRDFPAIVLIDELDVHLHPKWQRLIVPTLEDLFRSCQFIGTTHSPFVIQAVDRDKVQNADKQKPVQLGEGANSIEDIAEAVQEVPMPQRSVRAERLSEAAQRYFSLLKSDDAAPEAVRQAEQEYRRASEPFTDNPAAHALLKVEILEADT